MTAPDTAVPETSYRGIKEEMDVAEECLLGYRTAAVKYTAKRKAVLVHGTIAIAVAGSAQVAIAIQRPATSAPALVFDSITVVDVAQGKLVPNRRVVVAGNRIQAVGDVSAAKTPQGAQVVHARGKYLIPGLWDMHVHVALNSTRFEDYTSYLLGGVTGVREAAESQIPFETLRQWRKEINAGTRVGPRLILAGPSINVVAIELAGDDGSLLKYLDGPYDQVTEVRLVYRGEWAYLDSLARYDNPKADQAREQEVMDSFVIARGRPRHLVDSLKASGATFLKLRKLSARMYFALAAEARRAGLPFGGHAEGFPLGGRGEAISALDASDSGATIIDHPEFYSPPGGLNARCVPRLPSASLERCREAAERFRRNGTWWVPTLGVFTTGMHEDKYRCQYVDPRRQPELEATNCKADSLGFLYLASRVNLPIMAGTDLTRFDGAGLHAELRLYVSEGMTPLQALRTATLNVAEYLRGTDSLGTVAPGKLADLVLLDADPLKDIANTEKIHAVVANGHYFNRAALDSLLTKPKPSSEGTP